MGGCRSGSLSSTRMLDCAAAHGETKPEKALVEFEKEVAEYEIMSVQLFIPVHEAPCSSRGRDLIPNPTQQGPERA